MTTSRPALTSFVSTGLRCEGWLYRPEGRSPSPVIVMAHGLGGVRDAVLPAVAERFADAGWCVLLFDYRHWGSSEGEPRQLIDIRRKRDDYRAAVDYVRSLPDVDSTRVALWGTSFSGGHALAVAAEDSAVAAVVIQNPYVDGRAAAALTRGTAGTGAVLSLLWRGVRDLARSRTGRSPCRVPLVGEPGEPALITAPGAASAYRSVVPPGPGGDVPAVPARLVLELARDRPGRQAARVRCPLLVCVCDQDTVAPRGAARAVARTAPRGELRGYPIGHFDLFHDPWRDRVVDDQIAFLRRALD